MAIKLRRGLEIDRMPIVFAQGEIVYVTDTKKVYIGDGVTYGGNLVTGEELLSALDDVQLTSLSNDDVLIYESSTSKWKNRPFSTRVRDVVLTGLNTATNAIISATDSVLVAFGKLQAQITANLSTLTSHISNVSNPHSVTKSQVGLGDVLNVDTTNASNISSGTLNDARLSANVTLQGNTFNAANKLVQLDASAKLPAVDGSQLTNLNIPPSTGGDLYLFYNY
jgi:hypothetical protein